MKTNSRQIRPPLPGPPLPDHAPHPPPLYLPVDERPTTFDALLRVFLVVCLMASLLVCGLALSGCRRPRKRSPPQTRSHVRAPAARSAVRHPAAPSRPLTRSRSCPRP